MQRLGEHAIVLGASMGGLLAARALRDHFRCVTLIERDPAVGFGESRKGVPQDRHAHALLAEGAAVLERFFPGFKADMVSLGGLLGNVLQDGNWVLDGHRLPRAMSDVESVLSTRPLLESYVRQRLLEEGGVSVRTRCEAVGLIGDFAAVRGARVRDLEHAEHAEYELAAELVVDATGRGSRFSKWLETLGRRAPEEERIEVDLGYVSAVYRAYPGMFRNGRAAVIAVSPPARRSGVALSIEGDRVLVTLCGYLREHPISDHAAMREFARGLAADDLAQFLASAEPLSPPVAFKFPHSRRVRYERVVGHPAGALAFGDALCSFNPVYGQGMTVAALEAEALGRSCARARRQLGFDLPRHFYREAARIIDGPWLMAAGADLRFPEVAGPRTAFGSFMNRYFARLVRAASVDVVTARQLVRVLQLLDPPAALLRPAQLLRVWWFSRGVRAALALPRDLSVSGVRGG